MSGWEDFPAINKTVDNSGWDAFPTVDSSNPDQEVADIAEQSSPGFSERLGKRLEVRKQELEETGESLKSGKIGPFEATVQVIGKGVAGSLLDVIGEGMTSAGHGISYLIPDDTEEEIVNNVKSGLEYLSGTEGGQYAVKAIEEGADAWDKWKAENPERAKTVESVVNTAMIFAPAKVKKNAAPSKLGVAADSLDRKAASQLARKKSDFVGELIMPKKTPKVRAEQALRTEEVGKGPWRHNVVNKTTRETEIAREVERISGVGSNKTIQGNLNLIQKQNEALRTKLENDLLRDTTIIPRGDVRDRIIAAADDVVANNITVVGEPALKRVAERVRDEAIKLLDDGQSSPLGLLRVRRKLDNWVKDSRKNSLDIDASVTTLNASARRIRDELNQVIEDYAKTTNVKESLKRQSLLYDAIDNIAPKAADEYNTAIGRALQNAAKVVPIRNKAIQEGAVMLGIPAFGAASKLAPWFTGIAAVTGVSVLGGKAVMSPSTKKGIAHVIRAVDKAVTDSGNSAMRHQLRTDRGLLVELLKNAEIVEEEQQ